MATDTRQPQSAWALLADIVGAVVSIVKGHLITLRNFTRAKATDQYPYRQPDREWVPRPGYRGDFALIADTERLGGLRCIACMACANTCPTGCIHIQADGKGKERHPVAFDIDIGLCMYCWLCVEACPVGAITMTSEYHNVSFTPQGFIRTLEDLAARGEGIAEPQLPVPVEKSILKPPAKKAAAKDESGVASPKS